MDDEDNFLSSKPKYERTLKFVPPTWLTGKKEEATAELLLPSERQETLDF